MEKAGNTAITEAEREGEDNDDSHPTESETDTTEEVEENENEDSNRSEIDRSVAEAVRDSTLNRPMGLTESATHWLGEPALQPAEQLNQEQDQVSERMARVAKFLTQNRATGLRMVDVADAYTRVPYETSSGESASTSNESHETDTIESMPSLEPREEEEEEEEE